MLPSWLFEIGRCLFEKTIVMPHNQNMVCVRYRLLRGDTARLTLCPFVAFRRQDAPLNQDTSLPFELTVGSQHCELSRSEAVAPTLHFRLLPGTGEFIADGASQEGAIYRVERQRGHDYRETLYSPGRFSVELRGMHPVSFVATTQAPHTMVVDGTSALDAEHARVEKLLALAPEAAQEEFAAQLVVAADKFIVSPGSRIEETIAASAAGDEVRTIIAGYHWFGDWGRDTMISLEGLTLSTGRAREAGAILRTFSRYIEDGLLPNLFPEGEREALYHTADATFWYFHAIERYPECLSASAATHLYGPCCRHQSA